MAATWFISRDGKQHGPITDREFRRLVELGHLKDTDFVWHEGAPEWMPGSQFRERPIVAETAKPVSPPSSEAEQGISTAGPSEPAASQRRRGRRAAFVGGVVFLALIAVASLLVFRILR